MYEKPLVIARTGDVERAPENTLPAFESAIVRGADGVELDVHLSSDDQLVVHHFYNLGATDNGAGLVGDHTLLDSAEQIQRALSLGIDVFSTGHLGMALQVRNAFIQSDSLG